MQDNNETGNFYASHPDHQDDRQQIVYDLLWTITRWVPDQRYKTLDTFSGCVSKIHDFFDKFINLQDQEPIEIIDSSVELPGVYIYDGHVVTKYQFKVVFVKVMQLIIHLCKDAASVQDFEEKIYFPHHYIENLWEYTKISYSRASNVRPKKFQDALIIICDFLSNLKTHTIMEESFSSSRLWQKLQTVNDTSEFKRISTECRICFDEDVFEGNFAVLDNCEHIYCSNCSEIWFEKR